MTDESVIANSFYNLAAWIDEVDKIVDREVGSISGDQVQNDLRALASFLDHHPRISQRLSEVLSEGEWDINVDELSGHNDQIDYPEVFGTCDDPDCAYDNEDDLDLTNEEFEALILTDKGRIALLEIEIEELRTSLQQFAGRVMVLEATKPFQPYVPYQPYPVQPYAGWTCSTCGTFVSSGTVHQCGNQWTSPFVYSSGHPISDSTE